MEVSNNEELSYEELIMFCDICDNGGIVEVEKELDMLQNFCREYPTPGNRAAADYHWKFLIELYKIVDRAAALQSIINKSY